jgi:hypothetical protein
MFCDHPPDEKGPVVRQKFEFASLVSKRRRGWAGLLTCLALSAFALSSSRLSAQDKEKDSEADATRKAANISWNPKLSFEEWRALDKVRFIEFDSKLSGASFTEAEKKVLLKHLQNLIHGLTVEQNVDRHHLIIRNITGAAESPRTSPAGRDLILENTLKMVEPLLDEQPPNVQYSLVLLVASLNSKSAKLVPPPAVPAQPYPEIRKFLMKVVLADPPKPISARIIAVRGLERLMRDGDISTVNKSDIGVALAKALEQKVENPLARKWYRWKLVDALGVTGRYEEVGNRPVIIDGLMSVITNPKDDWEVRTAAARAVSQLPLDQKVNVELVNYEVVLLLYELATAYKASDRMPPSTWRWSFDNIYLAYKSATTNDQTNRHWGLMHLASPSGRNAIETAYKTIVLPTVKPILEQQTLPPLNDAAIKKLREWLEKNTPANRQVTSQSPALRVLESEPNKAAKQENGATPTGGGP